MSMCAAAALQASKAFFEAERRYNYTTPKTFLELIKLYKNVLTGKRKQTQEAIDRCVCALALASSKQSMQCVLQAGAICANM